MFGDPISLIKALNKIDINDIPEVVGKVKYSVDESNFFMKILLDNVKQLEKKYDIKGEKLECLKKAIDDNIIYCYQEDFDNNKPKSKLCDTLHWIAINEYKDGLPVRNFEEYWVYNNDALGIYYLNIAIKLADEFCNCCLKGNFEWEDSIRESMSIIEDLLKRTIKRYDEERETELTDNDFKDPLYQNA
jgi:hypothetical protein